MTHYYYLLSDWKIFSVTGPDAADFLQRVSSQNYKNPVVGDTKDMAVLTATGDIIGYCIGWHAKANDFGFAIHQSELDRTLAALEQFHFSEDLTITRHEHQTPILLFSDSASAETTIPTEAFPTMTWFARRGCNLTDLWMIVENDEVANWKVVFQSKSVIPASADVFNYFRIQGGWPLPDIDYDEDSMILSVGLGRGAAFNKGCYPGQEVVERATAIGSSPKCLVSIRFSELTNPGTLTLPCPIQIGDKEVGTLTSLAEHNGHVMGLGQIKRKFAAVGAPITSGTATGLITVIF